MLSFVDKTQDKTATKQNVANVFLGKKKEEQNKASLHEITILPTICTGVELDLS
jgi:hypothetical protein